MSGWIINNLGFDYEAALDVKGRLSIADLFPKSKNRCGIYLLNFSDGTFYIGQAVDVVRRFAQHRKNYSNILQMWFQSVKKIDLNSVEQSLIQMAETQNLLITNKVFVSNIIGETDLDEVISPDEQKQWLLGSHDDIQDEFDLYTTVDERHILKYRQNFEKLSKDDCYPQVKRILKSYIQNCLPAYKKTELSFWSLSCLPATNKNTFPRFFCLNVNGMEVVVLGYEKKSTQPFAFFILAESVVNNEAVIKKLMSTYKTLEVAESEYRAAGRDQICFLFSDLIELEQMLTSETLVISAIKELNLRLMRKGGTVYSPFHCFDLVKDVLM